MGKRLWLACCLWLSLAILVWPEAARALDFAVFPLKELETRSDTIVTGVVGRFSKAEPSSHVYEVRAEKVWKGTAKPGEILKVKVLQFGEDGVLQQGKRYLLLLTGSSSTYGMAGVHKGMIRLEDGTSHSRFYKPEEVDASFGFQSLFEQEQLSDGIQRITAPGLSPPPIDDQSASRLPLLVGAAGVVTIALVTAAVYRAKRQ